MRCSYDIVRRAHMRCAATLVCVCVCWPSAKCSVSSPSAFYTHKHTNSPECFALPDCGVLEWRQTRTRACDRIRSLTRRTVQVHIIEVNWSDWLYNCWKYAFFPSFISDFFFFLSLSDPPFRDFSSQIWVLWDHNLYTCLDARLNLFESQLFLGISRHIFSAKLVNVSTFIGFGSFSFFFCHWILCILKC